MELFLQGLRKSAGSPEKTEITVPWGEGAKGGNEGWGWGGGPLVRDLGKPLWDPPSHKAHPQLQPDPLLLGKNLHSQLPQPA